MTVISATKDPEALTLTFVCEFDASVERVWQIWEDPRQLERWWGPPTYPATFVKHEAVVGTQSHYYMTGPDGEKMHGWWLITDVDAPHLFEFDDGFADENGSPTGDLGSTHGAVVIERAGGGSGDDSGDSAGSGKTVMTISSKFDSLEQLDQMVEMGMEEGMREALGQADEILAG
ncbi:SRPBCC family protein [Marisediminicola sp. LYQ85]|uniref:SRPBCC family protein n=1 Tax=Marisediminicola sp. LYQ85 TaxID=3391062 RepID=UPI0039835298